VRVAIIAALPREVLQLVWGLKPDRELKRRGVTLFRMPNAVVAMAGMGAERVTLAVEAALARFHAGMLVSAGLAGACDPWLQPGWAAEATTVVDAGTGERYATDASKGSALDPRLGTRPTRDSLLLVTQPAIASVAEKARLHRAYGAAMVDMEAATVARLARAHGLAFRAIKGISDAHGFELEGLGQFVGDRGEFRTAAFALHTALRPWTWRKAMELGQGSNVALGALTARLRQVIAGDEIR
jgi:adenosylhomocysteine nucleosidase